MAFLFRQRCHIGLDWGVNWACFIAHHVPRRKPGSRRRRPFSPSWPPAFAGVREGISRRGAGAQRFCSRGDAEARRKGRSAPLRENLPVAGDGANGRPPPRHPGLDPGGLLPCERYILFPGEGRGPRGAAPCLLDPGFRRGTLYLLDRYSRRLDRGPDFFFAKARRVPGRARDDDRKETWVRAETQRAQRLCSRGGAEKRQICASARKSSPRLRVSA